MVIWSSYFQLVFRLTLKNVVDFVWTRSVQETCGSKFGSDDKRYIYTEREDIEFLTLEMVRSRRRKGYK